MIKSIVFFFGVRGMHDAREGIEITEYTFFHSQWGRKNICEIGATVERRLTTLIQQLFTSNGCRESNQISPTWGSLLFATGAGRTKPGLHHQLLFQATGKAIIDVTWPGGPLKCSNSHVMPGIHCLAPSFYSFARHTGTLARWASIASLDFLAFALKQQQSSRPHTKPLVHIPSTKRSINSEIREEQPGAICILTAVWRCLSLKRTGSHIHERYIYISTK